MSPDIGNEGDHAGPPAQRGRAYGCERVCTVKTPLRPPPLSRPPNPLAQ